MSPWAPSAPRRCDFAGGDAGETRAAILLSMSTFDVLRRAAFAAATLSFLAAAACRATDPPAWFSEEPVESGKWVAASGVPDWVTAPPARDGWFRFVVEGKSNLRGIAAGGRRPNPDRAVAELLRARLHSDTGVVDPVQMAITAAVSGTRMVSRACCEEVLTPDPVPGNTLCTAWALWETPIDPIVAGMSEQTADDWRAALAVPHGVAPPVLHADK